jgi:hypothetical protein
VHYIPSPEWQSPNCTGTNNIDIFLFSGARDRHLLPFLFTSIQTFAKCHDLIHIAVPAHEAEAIRPFLPELPTLRVHPISVPEEVCQWSTEGRPWGMWKDIGQWVNLWADNFSKAEYIMQLDSDTVFNFPVTRQTLFDAAGQPFMPFWEAQPAPWTELSSTLFGHPEQQFMSYFPVISTPMALKTVREAVAAHFDMPFNEAMGKPRIFSQFDLIGHAMVHLGYRAQPCKHTPNGSPDDWCTHRPHPVAHVPYADKCLVEGTADCYIPHKHGRSYGVMATDIILTGICFLHRHLAGPGDLPQYCETQALGNDVHHRAYSYSHKEKGLEMQRAAHFQRNLQLPQPPNWVRVLPMSNAKLNLVLPWDFDVHWTVVDNQKKLLEVQEAVPVAKFRSLSVQSSSLPSGCEDSPSYWQDTRGRTCDDYASQQLCTADGNYGLGWSQYWGSFADFAVNGISAIQACCRCGREVVCVRDVMLVVDRSGSIGTENWKQMVAYMKDRVTRTPFTDVSGNRIGIVTYSTYAELACPLQFNRADLLDCIDRIVYTGGWTNTAQGIFDAGTQLDADSSPSRTRVIEVITDGVSQLFPGDRISTMQTTRMAELQKSKGVILLAIGVGGGANVQELESMASEPKESHWTNLGSFDSLTKLSEALSGSCVPEVPGGSDRLWECKAMDSRSTDAWCAKNCYDENNRLVAACDADSGADQVCLCPVDCKLGLWEPWAPCTATCGGGYSLRTRPIITLPADGGAPCSGPTHMRRSCNADPCECPAETGDAENMDCPGADALLGACNIQCGRLVCPGKTKDEVEAMCTAVSTDFWNSLGLTEPNN